MSGLISRVPAGLLTSGALALAALILTSFFDAGPNPGTGAGSTIHVESGAARPWCGPAERAGARSCRYWTFEQCLAAASADYRTCKPNPAAVVIHDDVPYWTYRSVFL
ncbi:MAG: hypothetical protein ACJ8FK_19435 [Xanthobacteraceae bacterium]